MAGKKKKDIFADIKEYNSKLNLEEWNGTIKDYIPMVQKNPKLAQLSHARVLDMIESAGVEFDEKDKNKNNPKYNFFAEDLFGVDKPIGKAVKYLKAAASGSQVGRRILLLYGPTSSGKSQMATLLKKGLEEFSKTEDGAVYAIADCPIHENPLNAVPHALRNKFRDEHGIRIDPLAMLCPVCQFNLENQYNSDWLSMPVKRVFISEASRLGIGTFLPGDVKCLTGDTSILTKSGLKDIRDIVGTNQEDDIDEMVYVDDTSLQPAVKSFTYRNKKIKKIKTELGYSISGSLNHPLRTVDDSGNFIWKPMSELEEGDSLVMSCGSGINFATKPLPENSLGVTELSDNLATYIGLYIAEGYIDKKGRHVELTNSSPEIQEIIKNTMIELGIGDNHHLYNNIRNVTCSRDLVKTMKTFGFTDNGAHHKCIPDCIMASGKLDKVLLGMWLGDGNCGKHNGKNTNEAIYSTVSKKLAKQVHLLLLALGIPSNKRFCENVGTNGAYNILVSGVRVHDLIEKLQMPAWKLTRDLVALEVSNDNVLLMPDLNKIVEKVYQPRLGKWYRYAKNNKHARKFTRNSFKQFLRDVENVGADSESLAKLVNLNNDNFVYLRIKSIEDDIANVYDIEVPKYHNFIANGFVSHNSQSITELVGSVDFSKLAEYGVESDPRAYKFDGELNVSNRGLIEMIEMLKVDPKFMYVLLTLAQEKTIKTERFPLIYADEFILSHTNETEYKRFLGDKKMEALHDRIIVCKFPYNLEVNSEIKIYEKLISEADFKGVHIAPLTLQVASMFAVLSRLEPGKDQNLTLVKKMQLYNGEDVDGFTAEDVKDIKEEADEEGMFGISPRYIINCISDCFTKYDSKCVTPIDILRSIKENFGSNAKLNKDDIDRFDDLLTEVVEQYTRLAKTEVQKAFFVSFESEIENLLNNYVDNIGAFLDKSTVEDEFGDYHEPDNHLMRSIEEKVGVSEAGKESFRQEVYRKVLKAKSETGKFDYKTHAKLREALEKQLFDERADTIRLTISSRNPDPEALQRLNKVIDTLVKERGYTVESANQLLRYVNSLMSRTS